MRPIRHWLCAFVAASSLLLAGAAAAQNYDHSVYLDLDNDTATGCTTATPAGAVAGAEVRLVATVSGTPPMVTGVTRAQCTGGVFGAPVAQPAAYAIGLNNGINGGDVVEIGTALAGLGQGGAARITFVSANANGADLASGVLQLPGGGAVGPIQPILVPATGLLALLFIAGLVLILARKHPAFGSSVVLLLAIGAGAVWAANFVVDGQIGDWAGVSPLASDPPNDGSGADPRVEIVAVFAATEGGNLFLRIDVQDAQTPNNTAPVANDAGFNLAENSINGTAVGSVAATDANAGQTLTYAITAGNGSGAFAINASTGALSVANAAALDFETTPSFSLTVTVTDNGTPPLNDSATIVVSLSNVNEAPVLADATRAVAEDSPAGTNVGAPLAATDPDAGAVLAYAITAGNTNATFAISNTGQVSVANAAGVADIGSYALTVTVTDQGGLTDTAAITVNVTDQNDAPTFTGEPYAFTLAENSIATTVAGSVAAVDSDVGQTLAYAITGGNTANAFAMSAAGQISVATPAAVDFEATPVFTLTVTVTDNGAPALSDTTTVTITLTDVNEAPVATDGNFAVAESASAGTSVGTVAATDPDLDPPNPPSGNATLSYAITAGNAGNVFAINAATGEITTAATLVLASSPYTLTVTVTDNGAPALSDTATVVITVTDQNDAPTLADAAFSLAENSANGTPVGTVTATDPDAGQVTTYAITGGNGAGGFAIDAGTGAISVANGAALDFETTPTFTLTVTATDNGTPALSDTAVVTITLTDANDAPVVDDASFTLAENSGNGTSVGTVSASDQDAGQTRTWAITSGSGAAFFAIGAGTGAITVSNSAGLDFETTPTLTLVVSATDNGAPPLTHSGTVTVTLTNVNEAPVATDASFSVPENSGNGTNVGSVSATDPDAGSTLTYSITAGNTNGAFAIGAGTGVIAVANSAEMDFGTVFNLTVQVSDGALSDTATVVVTVDDVNEAPVPSAVPAAPSIFEDLPTGTTVATISPNDPDAGQSHTYSIVSGNTGNAFAIDAAGDLTLANPLDFEALASYTLIVRATDNGTPVLFGDVTIAVTIEDANETPTVGAGATLSYQEGDGARVVDATVTVSDPDAGEGIELAVVQIGANYAAGQDVLALPVTPGFTAVFNAGTGVLNITASNTPANWQAVLRTVTYENTSAAPSTLTRTVSWNVSDGALLSNTASSTITLGATNSAPVINSNIPPTATEDVAYIYAATATDADGPGATWSLTAANTCAGASIGPATGIYSFTPAGPVPPASCVVALQVCDGGAPDQCATQSATITIVAVNDAPTIDSTPPTTATEDQPYSYNATAADPDGTGTVWSTIAGNTCAGTINAASGQYTFTPAGPTPPASCAIAIQVCDVGGQCGTQTTSIAITAVNSAPVIDSTPPATATEDTLYTYNATRTDADGPGQTWSLTAGNTCAGASIVAGTGVYTFTPAGPTPPASCVVAVQVCDGGTPDQCATQTTTIAITAVNDAPTVTSSAPTTATEDVLYTYTATATDPEGGNFTWSAGAGNTCGGSFAADVYTFTPLGPNPAATCVVAVQACDDGTPSECVTQNTTVTITPVNDVPVTTVPGAQSMNEDATLVLSGGNAIVVNDPDANGNPIRVVVSISDGTLDAVNAAGATLTGDGTGSVTIQGTQTAVNAALNGLAYAPSANFFGNVTLNVATDDLGSTGGGSLTDSDTVAITVLPVNDAPTATAKTHATHSGIGLTIDAASHLGELKEGAADVDDTLAELTVELVGLPSQAEAAVTLVSNADGSFTFDPPGGFTGPVTFQYRVCDDNVGDPNRCSAAATVTVNVGGTQTWFIDDTDAAACGAGCTGSRLRPLVGLGNADPQYAARGIGDSIFVFSGTYAQGHTFAANERLVGQGASDIAGALNHNYAPYTNGLLATPPAPGAAPQLGNTVTLATNVLMRGIAITGGTSALAGTNVTGIDVGESSINTANTAINFNGVNGNVALSSTTSTGGAAGMLLANLAGTHSFGTGNLSGHTSAGILINNTAVTTPTLTYAGTINPAAGGRVVEIGNAGANSGLRGGTYTLSGNLGNTSANNRGVGMSNSTGGTLTLSGAQKRFNSAGVTAVAMANNTGGTLEFTNGGLDIDTTTADAINASGAGTLRVAGNGNTVASTASTAIRVNAVAAQLRFQSVDSANAGNGIELVNTGAGPALTVTGDGITAGSGGTISNVTGGDGGTTGNSIRLSTVTGVDLAFMTVDGSSNNGLRGDLVTDLRLADMQFTGNHGTTVALDESAVHLTELGGTVDFVRSTFNGGRENGVRIANATARTLGFTFDTNQVTSMQGTTADVGGSAVLLTLSDGVVTSNIKNSNVTQWWGNAIHVLHNGAATGITRITGNTVNNTNGALAGAGGIWVAGGAGLNYLVSGNNVRNTNGSAISIDRVTNTSGRVHGVIENNTVGIAGANNSGSTVGSGIFISHTGSGATQALVRNNIVRQVGANNASGVVTIVSGDAVGGGGSGTIDVTLTGNTLAESGSPMLAQHHAILVTHGRQSGPPTDTDIGCYDIGGAGALANTISGINSASAPTAQNRIRINQRFGTTSRWPGYTGAATGATSQTDLGAYLIARNPTLANATNANTSTGGFTNTIPPGSGCTLPTVLSPL